MYRPTEHPAHGQEGVEVRRTFASFPLAQGLPAFCNLFGQLVLGQPQTCPFGPDRRRHSGCHFAVVSYLTHKVGIGDVFVKQFLR